MRARKHGRSASKRRKRYDPGRRRRFIKKFAMTLVTMMALAMIFSNAYYKAKAPQPIAGNTKKDPIQKRIPTSGTVSPPEDPNSKFPF